MKNFKTLLKELHACSDAKKWAGDMTIEEVVEKCHRGDWLLWLAARVRVESRPLTFTKGHCANTVRHLMKDERSIKAVDAAIAYGEGKIDENQLADAVSAAFAASADAAYVYATNAAYASDAAAAYTSYAADAAYAAADDDATYATNATYTADAATYAAAAAYTADENRKENQLQTADICRKYIGQLIVDKVNQRLNDNV